MPEAAEVTVASRQLDRVAAGRVLTGLDVTHPRTTRAQPVDALAAFVGARVGGVTRHGKWLVVAFDDVEPALGIHLRMSGQLLARDAGDEPPDDPFGRHVHARLHLAPRPPPPVLVVGSDEMSLDSTTRTGLGGDAVDVWFRDPRTFGEIRVLHGGAPVAPDLFDPAVTADVLAAGAARRRVGVKAVLLEQTRTVSGIGSYLADEALHRAGISPLQPAALLRTAAWDRILVATRSVAEEAAAVGGVTLADEGWLDLWGRPGRFGPRLRVHARATCGTCGAVTHRGVVGGRSARWCPCCQDPRRNR